MARVSGQGNVLGFVLVGALLVASLLGGIYVVRHVSDSGSTVPTSTQEGTSSSTTKESDTDSTTSQTAGQSGDDQDLKQALEAQSAAEKKAKEPQAASNAANSDADRSTSSSATSLPATGPEEVVFPLLGATLLAGTILAYARSRRLI